MSRSSPARPQAQRAPAAGRGKPHTIRIIGGDWKRTPLPVLDLDGLRPTPDRVRETLFNWLGQDLEGRRCLDLFAGSGALGFEAAARGAASGEVRARVRRCHLDALLAQLWLAFGRYWLPTTSPNGPDSGPARRVLPPPLTSGNTSSAKRYDSSRCG